MDAYSNANFTILQAIIECVNKRTRESPDYFATYVEDKVFRPMGIDTAVFNPIPDVQESATLSYYSCSDLNPGQYYKQTNMIGAAGWISSATEVANLLIGLRRNTVLDQDKTAQMFNQCAY